MSITMTDEILANIISTNALVYSKELMSFLVQSGITQSCYAYRFREKNKENLLAKQKRKRKNPETPNYSLTDITDVIGIRFVTLFKEDMQYVFKKILEVLSNKKYDNVFSNAHPEEIIFYKGNIAKDIFYEDLKEIAEEKFSGTKVLIKNSVQNYSSIHLICRYKDFIDGIKKTNGDNYSIPIEIQVRTVFEDAWSEISHKYVHSKIRDGEIESQLNTNYNLIIKHILSLKNFTDACREYAEIIKKQSDEALYGISVSAKVNPIDSDAINVKRFKELKVNDTYINLYKEATFYLDKNNDNSNKDLKCNDDKYKHSLQSNYIIAADLFSNLSFQVQSLQDVQELPYELQLFYYHCKLDEGFCRMSTGENLEINKALEIFSSIEERFHDYPVLKMRIGQALGRLGNFTSAITKLSLAYKMMQDFDIKNNNFTDKMTSKDYEYMVYALPRLLGYFTWKSIDHQNMPNHVKLELCRKAYDWTSGSYEYATNDSKKIDTLNNMLYFNLYLMNEIREGEEYLVISRKISKDLEELESLCPIDENISIEVCDTFFKSFAYLKNERARSVAETLKEKCIDETPSTPQRSLIIHTLAKAARDYLDSGLLPQI